MALPATPRPRCPPLARWSLALTLALCAACAPKDFRYEPTGEDRDALLAVAARVAAGDLEPGQVDLEARKALLLFGASLAYEQRERVKAAVDEAGASLVMTLALQLLGGWDEAQGEAATAAALARASRTLEAQLEGEFGVSPQELLGGPDVLTALASQAREPPEAGAARLLAKLREEPPGACHVTGLLASYDVRLLRWTRWAYADRSRTFTGWKRHARSLHLVELSCEARRGVVLLARDERHAGPRVVGWRSSSPTLHARLLARLGVGAAAGPAR